MVFQGAASKTFHWQAEVSPCNPDSRELLHPNSARWDRFAASLEGRGIRVSPDPIPPLTCVRCLFYPPLILSTIFDSPPAPPPPSPLHHHFNPLFSILYCTLLRHIVLVVYHIPSRKWGALGLSRRPELMDKDLVYDSLAGTVVLRVRNLQGCVPGDSFPLGAQSCWREGLENVLPWTSIDGGRGHDMLHRPYFLELASAYVVN